MEYFVMNNGVRMPMAGIGVFLFTPAEAESAVKTALSDGVRLIDTANAYLNEKAVGRAIKASSVKRSDIFLVSKLWPTVYGSDTAVDDTLRRLDTDYVDLMFLHQPTANWKDGYRQLEKAYREGKIRAIGLSNFPEEMIREALAEMEIKPQMVQVEAHPYFPETALKAMLKPEGIGLMAWYPLGHGDAALLREPVFAELGLKYGKSPAQIILRWHVQSGNVVFPGSRNSEHIRANFAIFDFSLTGEEMAAIAAVDKDKRYYYATPEIVRKYAAMDLDFDAQE